MGRRGKEKTNMSAEHDKGDRTGHVPEVAQPVQVQLEPGQVPEQEHW